MFDSEQLTSRNLDKFLSEYKSFIDLIESGERSRAYKEIARIYREIGQFRTAVKYYQKALSIDSNDIESYLNLCSIYIEMGLFHSANMALEKLYSLLERDATILNTLKTMKSNIPKHSIKSVTFYLPCYNQEKFISQCLESVLSQSYPIIEVLLIDDGSTDKSVEIAERYPVKIIRHKVNKGLAYARNTAIRYAKGDFIASIDTDVILDEFWLERLMRHFDDPTVVVTGGRLIEANTATVADRWRQVRMAQGKNKEQTERDVLIFGSNSVFRKGIFVEIGGYDIRLKSNLEDFDICKRIINKGYSTLYDPTAICRHLRNDNIIKVVDTCYNWRSAIYNVHGFFENIEKLTLRTIIIKNEIINDLKDLVRSKYFDILYFDFLQYHRTIFKDIIKITSRIGSERASFIVKSILQALLLNIKLDGLFKHLIEDTKDLLDTILEPSLGKDYFDKLSSHNNTEININNHSSKEDLPYLIKVTQGLTELFCVDIIILKMIHTSAMRAHQEEIKNPYEVSKKVMLLNPPCNVKGRRGVRAGSRWPFTGMKISEEHLHYTPYPFFLCYLSSLLKQRGIINVIVDAIAEELSDEEFMERVAGYQPDVVVIETSTASYVIDAWWIILIKERVPDCKVILTGSHVSAQGKEIIRDNPFVDFVIRGEYEIAASDLIQRLINGIGDYTDIKGLIYKDHHRNIIDQGRTDPIDIESLPNPERLKTPIYKYNDLFAGMQFPCLQIHSSRGCPYGCIFCLWPQVLYGNKKYRTRDPIKVVDEIEEAIKTFGFRSFYFDDDTFNIGKERILALCSEIIERKINLPWGAMARADCLDFQMLKVMRDAGLVGIKFGVESANQGLVQSSGKHLNLDKVKEAVNWCKDLGIKTHQTIEQTIAFVKDVNPDSAQFSIVTPFPGTKYYEILKSQGNLLTEIWEFYDGALYTVVKSDSLSPQDLQRAVQRANREFYEFKVSQQCQKY